MENYLSYAERDWKSAHSLYEIGTSELHLVVYSAQQSAEKYAKEILERLEPNNNDELSSHSIWRIIQKFDPEINDDAIHLAAVNLTNLFYETRYPGKGHKLMVNKKEVVQALGHLNIIRDYCLEKLKILDGESQVQLVSCPNVDILTGVKDLAKNDVFLQNKKEEMK